MKKNLINEYKITPINYEILQEISNNGFADVINIDGLNYVTVACEQEGTLFDVYEDTFFDRAVRRYDDDTVHANRLIYAGFIVDKNGAILKGVINILTKEHRHYDENKNHYHSEPPQMISKSDKLSIETFFDEEYGFYFPLINFKNNHTISNLLSMNNSESFFTLVDNTCTFEYLQEQLDDDKALIKMLNQLQCAQIISGAIEEVAKANNHIAGEMRIANVLKMYELAFAHPGSMLAAAVSYG